jgi:uncharacterized protein (DUF2235 family)
MRKIIAFCDGTWNSSNLISTNVFRLYTLIQGMKDPNLITQYFNGVGTSSYSLLGNVLDGISGVSLETNIKQAYNFIACNYQEGDEILLFGFSRGAYTVRCVAGMIYNSGLVPSTIWTDEAYRRYRSRDPKDRPKSAESSQFKSELGCKEVQIKFLGLWDTVGAGGIPIHTQDGLEYMGFYDNVVSHIVQNVSHALAIHERMSPFEPCHVLKKPDNKITNVTEVWFPGEHLDIGGAKYFGFHDISCMTLEWMVDQVNNCTDLSIPTPSSEKGSLRRGIYDRVLTVIHPIFDYVLVLVATRTPIVRDRRITDYDVGAIYNGGKWGNDLTVNRLNAIFSSQTYNEYGRYMLKIRKKILPGFE